MAQTNIPFKVGQTIEVRSFEVGFRGAWFRCKILKIYTKEEKLYYSLKYLDYDDEEIHETQVFQPFEDEEKEWLMVRPSFPPVYHESEEKKIKSDKEPLVVVYDSWKVGDLIDWHRDDCYWSGTVLAKKKSKSVQVKLFPPPRGEGETYTAPSKDLRPSLEWSLEDGWTLPTVDGQKRQCARLVKRENEDHVTPDVSQTGKEQTESAKKLKSERATQQVEEGDGEFRLNIDESDSTEAAVYDLEELIARIQWIKGMLSPDVGEGSKSSWKYEDYRPS